MLGGLEFGFLPDVSFEFFTFSACHQFLSIFHDKMGQDLSLGKHILSYFVCYVKKRKMETSAALGSIVS